jgi:hypothetical protein
LQGAQFYKFAHSMGEKHINAARALQKSEAALRVRVAELHRAVEIAGTARLATVESGRAMNVRFWSPVEFARRYDEFSNAMEDMIVDLVEADVGAADLQGVCLELLNRTTALCARKVADSVEDLGALLHTSCVDDATDVLRSVFCHILTKTFVQECVNDCADVLRMRELVDRMPRGREQILKWVMLWVPLQCWQALGPRRAECSPASGVTPYDPTLHKLVCGYLEPGAGCRVLIPGCRLDSGHVVHSRACASE